MSFNQCQLYFVSRNLMLLYGSILYGLGIAFKKLQKVTLANLNIHYTYNHYETGYPTYRAGYFQKTGREIGTEVSDLFSDLSFVADFLSMYLKMLSDNLLIQKHYISSIQMVFKTNSCQFRGLVYCMDSESVMLSWHI